MTLPKPVPGLVINYAYLWADEALAGLHEGRKYRPCAIVLARLLVASSEIVMVAPITHSQPDMATPAIELPVALKAHLGLDDARSWVILTETNSFLWPGPDLRQIGRSKPARYAYGMLPPRFFAAVRDGIIRVHHERRFKTIKRKD